MKITHIIPHLATGGAQRLLADILPAQASAPDVELTVVVYRSEPESAIERRIAAMEGVRFVNLDLKQTRGLSPAFRLVSEVREADVIHVHLFPALYHAALASLIAGTPMVYTEHNTRNRRRERPWLRPVERMVYGVCRKLCAISGGAAASLAEWLGRDVSEIAVVPNGIDLTAYAVERPHPSQWPAIFGPEVSADRKCVLMASRFSEAKDQDTLIRAMALVRDPKAFVALAGDGPRLEECRRLAEEVGVAERVLFLGDRADIPRLMAASEVGVLSTHWEGMPMSVIEMMGAGLPSVVTDVAGIAETVGEAGLLVAESDPEALAAAIDTLLASPELVQNMRTRGKERALMFDARKTAEGYLTIYRNII